MASTLLFLDIETLGVSPDAAIWEVAAARFEDGRLQGTTSMYVRHDPARRDPDLPTPFMVDYERRFHAHADDAVHPKKMLDTLRRFAEGQAIVCGSNPRFDMDRLERLAAEHRVDAPPWHYHPHDIPSMVHGYLLGKGIAPAPPWRSNFLSQVIGIDPRDHERHTAEGDVWWCRALWAEMTGVPGGL